jgi:hypothetical protein
MRFDARLARLERVYAIQRVFRMSRAERRDAIGTLERTIDRLKRDGSEELSPEDRRRLAAIGAIFFLDIPAELGESPAGQDPAGKCSVAENP